MLSRKQEIRSTLLQVVDGLLVAAALWLGWKLRYSGVFSRLVEDLTWLEFPQNEQPFNSFTWLLYVMVPGLPLVLDQFNFYSRRRRFSIFKLIQKLVWLCLWFWRP